MSPPPVMTKRLKTSPSTLSGRKGFGQSGMPNALVVCSSSTISHLRICLPHVRVFFFVCGLSPSRTPPSIHGLGSPASLCLLEGLGIFGTDRSSLSSSSTGRRIHLHDDNTRNQIDTESDQPVTQNRSNNLSTPDPPLCAVNRKLPYVPPRHSSRGLRKSKVRRET